MKQGGWRPRLKRGLDIGIASAVLVAASPVMAGSALAVRVSMGSPILFRQARPGLGGQTIRILKFRTMRDALPHENGPEYDRARITRLGAFLRRTSIDELPQLLNVLRGEMSLVGPRPLVEAYLDRYTPEQRRRHDVLPGITGWAQIHGRNAITWEEKFRLDVWYVDNWSLGLDLEILARTLLEVIRGTGISMEGHATMPEFMGTAAEAG